jgi:hypothetical protein
VGVAALPWTRFYWRRLYLGQDPVDHDVFRGFAEPGIQLVQQIVMRGVAAKDIRSTNPYITI